MLNTIHDIFFSQTFPRYPYQRFVTLLAQSNELLCSQLFECMLKFAEGEFDRVELRRVGQVVDKEEPLLA